MSHCINLRCIQCYFDPLYCKVVAVVMKFSTLHVLSKSDRERQVVYGITSTQNIKKSNKSGRKEYNGSYQGISRGEIKLIVFKVTQL